MKRLITLTAILALSAGLVQAQSTTQTVTPGDNFMAQWDVDGDGKVTLAEAREHRGDIFAMFDSDDNGSFSADELKGIDEHKLMELEAGMGPGHNLPEGMQPGPKGKGPGMGKGQGQGQGMGQGMAGQGLNVSAEDGMKMFDTNRDGTVTRAEFVDGTDAWFKMRDMNGDGVLTLDDFGPRR
ncbi:MAG: hypothetical protein AB7U46_14640 [Paenirhodobacter sp.]|uniref:hypothetical protein n=1 Tax=Paenirhodobacter sp. TaxID=1965326 RepID=UPI003D099C5B